jgi:hypothetical protein
MDLRKMTIENLVKKAITTALDWERVRVARKGLEGFEIPLEAKYHTLANQLDACCAEAKARDWVSFDPENPGAGSYRRTK